MTSYQFQRADLEKWKEELLKNPYLEDEDFRDSVSRYLGGTGAEEKLTQFAQTVVTELEPLVQENHRPENLPRVERYDAIGRPVERVVHHPAYSAAGDLIYGSGLMKTMSCRGKLLEALSFMLLSSQVGEAGHNCPIACSAGIIRVFQKVDDFPRKQYFLDKLVEPSFQNNFTGAQFVTEVQGGSDVGANETRAYRDSQGVWRIEGEKWFCSNANADLILMTARFDPDLEGTKGLGLFLVPATLETGEPNNYSIRRLKEKMGTKTLATAEMDFQATLAIPMGPPHEGFKLLMENVLHISRLFNAFCVVGMARRALAIADAYARHRRAFGRPIIQFPLVEEKILRIKSENTALMASIFGMASLQDRFDTGEIYGTTSQLLLRLLANINKTLTALWSVRHIHHALNILAGKGTIETFSPIPRLFRDCIICENWEGTHNVLSQQILRDIHRYQVDEIFLEHAQTLNQGSELIDLRLEEFKDNLKGLKASTPEVQSARIQPLVHQMGTLYAALQLANEADGKTESKQNCLASFLHDHFSDSWKI